MPQLLYNPALSLFVWKADTLHEQKIAEEAGFELHSKGALVTSDKYKAYTLRGYGTKRAKKILDELHWHITESSSEEPSGSYSMPDDYKPFQKAGIEYILERKKRYFMLGDEPGLGKTIQFIGLANYSCAKKLLIVCPAHLRLNWEMELRKWSILSAPIQVVNSSKQELNPDATLIISYSMLKNFYPALKKMNFGMVGCDESHYLSSAESTRTKIMLGLGEYKVALVNRGKKCIFMTGTPIYNRADNLFPILKRCAPEVIDDTCYWGFVEKFCTIYDSGFGVSVTGSKNEKELYTRLRSGFMVRRLKKDVLDQLPSKQYKLAVYGQNMKIKHLFSKQENFTAKELKLRCKESGVAAVPDLRHEEGVDKVPAIADYAEMMMANGCKKLLIFAFHQEVVEALETELAEHNPLVIYGKTSAKEKQESVEKFQNEKLYKIFILNILAAGTGLTLTAASDGIFGEYSWNDADNEQVLDRMHRIGQENKVTAHYVVVENTLDTTVLSRALSKGEDNKLILDGV